MRFEFVWSLAISFVILSGAVVWTAASNTAPSVGIRQTAAADPADDFKACRQYSQYEFKVGYLVAPSCLPQTD